MKSGVVRTAHTIEEASRITEDDSKPSQVGDVSSFVMTEERDDPNEQFDNFACKMVETFLKIWYNELIENPE